MLKGFNYNYIKVINSFINNFAVDIDLEALINKPMVNYNHMVIDNYIIMAIHNFINMAITANKVTVINMVIIVNMAINYNFIEKADFTLKN